MPAEIAVFPDVHDKIPQPPNELERLLALQRKAFSANPMPTAGQRLQWLDTLRTLLSDEKQALIKAISADFSNRSADETLLAELMPGLAAIKDASKYLKKWMKPSRRKVGLAFQPASARVVYQPLGVVGVIAPWNYPLLLTIGPLVGALAACDRRTAQAPVRPGIPGRLDCRGAGRRRSRHGVLQTALRSPVVHRFHQYWPACHARRR